MTTNHNILVSRRWHEAWGTNAIIAAYEECLAPDFTGDFFGRGKVDRATYIARDQEFARAFNETSIRVVDAVADGDRVMVRMTWRARHIGLVFGLQPTGRSFEITGFAIDRFRAGMVIEHAPLFDTFSLLRQLGVQLPVGNG